MNSFIKKEDLVISIGEYTDKKTGAPKQQYKQIGEIITMQGDNGQYQFFKLWGSGGVTEGKVFEKKDPNQATQQQAPPPQQQGYQQQPQQQPTANQQMMQSNNQQYSQPQGEPPF